MSVQQSLRPALRVTIPAYRAAKPKSPTPIAINRLSLQVVKQIWSSYPVLNISSKTWEARLCPANDASGLPPMPNALGLDLGLPASGAYTLPNFMSTVEENPTPLIRGSSLEPGELLETAQSPRMLSSSPLRPSSPLTFPSSDDIANARALLLESFYHFASSPERTKFVAELEPKLTDELVSDIIRQGPIVLNDLRKSEYGERLDELKRKFGIMSGPQEASEEQVRRTRRRIGTMESMPAVPHVMRAANERDVEIQMAPPRPKSPVPEHGPAPESDPYSPRIYAAKTGQSTGSVVEMSFELDERAVEAARRWSRRGISFQATDPHVRLCFLGVRPTDARSVLEMPGATSSPANISILASQLPPVWPPEGTLYVSLNNGMGLWDASYFSPTSPGVDMSHAVKPGLNTIKVIGLGDLSSTIFMIILLPIQEAERRPWAQLEKLRKMAGNSNTNGSFIVDFVPS